MRSNIDGLDDGRGCSKNGQRQMGVSCAHVVITGGKEDEED